MVIMGLNPLVDRFIAQLSGPGSLSILDTAERVYAVLGVLCTIGLTTVLLTRFSQKASIGRLDHGWRRTLTLIAIWSLAWIIAGAAVGHWGLPWWLSRIAALKAHQCADVTEAYWYYLVGLPVFIVGVVYTRRIQALHRTSILVWAAGLAVVLNLIASLALRSALGIPGIALAKIPVHTATALVLIRAAHRKTVKP
jgi:peptidoglycan biosynthesis protein MviN/MurJ (putative lipid II flippase)